MRRHARIVIAFLSALAVCLSTAITGQASSATGVSSSVSATAGRVSGLVRDGAGQGVADASVLALGQSIISARSDVRGRFELSLPPGDYVLRATRSGYVSTYREPVRVDSRTQLERNITLTRQIGAADATLDDTHSHTDLAWALRHLPRSILRDGDLVRPSEPTTGSLFGGAASTSRLASAFADTDFRGQLNFVTTAVAQPLAAWAQTPWPRGVAFFTVGAPVIGYGAWQLRAAVASGDGSSWNLHGEYRSDRSRPHVWKLGLSYSAQGFTATEGRLSAAVAEARTVAGVSAQDEWQVSTGLTADYGVRAERFDYLANPQLFSANGGIRVRVMPRTFLRASAAQSMVAPGADEFLPPAAGGPWLPAERMFSPITGRGTLFAEQVRHGEMSITHQLGAGEAWPTLHVRRFRQQSTDQMATVFGLSGQDNRGQYFVGKVGDVDLVGWAAGISGQFGRHIRGQIEYARIASEWELSSRVRELRRVASSVLRNDLEQIQDVSASIAADVPWSGTHLDVVYRASTAFSRTGGSAAPGMGSRFDVQVRQALPYRLSRGSRLDLIFAVRNLFRDLRGDASWYDELLTVGPPIRFMGGIQVRF